MECCVFILAVWLASGCSLLFSPVAGNDAALADAEFASTDGAAGPKRVYQSSGGAVGIPDDDPNGITDLIAVTETCTISSVIVNVDIRHSHRGDVTISLTSPVGIGVNLKGFMENDADDDILGAFPTTLLPIQSLDVLTDSEAQGNWTLDVVDLELFDEGTLESWSLELICR